MDLRTQLKILILELWNGANESRSEEIADFLNKHSPDPNWSNYLFHSEEFIGENETLLVEKLLDYIFAYVPIQIQMNPRANQ